MVTGCASGIGAHVARQLTELGAHVVGLDKQPPSSEIAEFYFVDLTDPESIDRGVSSVGDQIDALFNVAGVSSGIGDPLLVVTINFLGLRHLTESLVHTMPAGSSVVSVSSLAAKAYRENRRNHRRAAAHCDDGRRHRLVQSPSRRAWRRGLPVVQGSGHPVLHEQDHRTWPPGYSNQLHRAWESPRPRFWINCGGRTARISSTTSPNRSAGCLIPQNRPRHWFS